MRVAAALLCWAALAQAWQKPEASSASRPAATLERSSGALANPEDLKFPPLKAIEISKPEVLRLANGMRVLLLENHELSIVRGTMLVRTGNLFDPKTKRGLATITGMTLRTGGTVELTGEEIDRRLEETAAAIESSIDDTTGTVRFHCFKEDTDSTLAILRDVMEKPAFRENKIDLAKTQLRSSIARRNDEPAGIASREFFRLVYGPDTAYGGMEEYATVAAVTRADIKAFYTRYFFPANITMAVYGDFSTGRMKSKLEELFGGWNASQAKVPPFPAVEEIARPGIYLVERMGVEQAFLEIGELGGEFRDQDYPALSVAADVLGGGFSSRLLREIRSRLGYTYDIEAGWDADYDHPGVFRIACSTKPEAMPDSVRAILREVDRLRTDLVSEEELRIAKNSALNSLVFAFERPSNILSRLITYEYFGYPDDFLARYQREVEAVTRQDILRAAQRYFEPSKLIIVAVVKPSSGGVGGGSKLADLHLPVRELDISIPQPSRRGLRREAQQR